MYTITFYVYALIKYSNTLNAAANTSDQYIIYAMQLFGIMFKNTSYYIILHAYNMSFMNYINY